MSKTTASLSATRLTDIATLCKCARRQIEDGALTPNYGVDHDFVLRLPNAALATDIVCSLRYKRHYSTAKGLTTTAIAVEFVEHAR